MHDRERGILFLFYFYFYFCFFFSKGFNQILMYCPKKRKERRKRKRTSSNASDDRDLVIDPSLTSKYLQETQNFLDLYQKKNKTPLHSSSLLL